MCFANLIARTGEAITGRANVVNGNPVPDIALAFKKSIAGKHWLQAPCPHKTRGQWEREKYCMWFDSF